MGSKRKRNFDAPPIQIPIFIPTNEGAGELVLGSTEVRGSTLVITFNDLIPSQAIKHRIERGEVVGITFVIPADENEIHEENENAIQAEQDAKRAQEERDAADLEMLSTDDIRPEDFGN